MAYDEDLADRIRDILAPERGLTEKRMFGGLAFLIDGHMAVAASSHRGLLLRVDPARTDELLSPPDVGRFVMRGREMDGWLRVDPPAVDTEDRLTYWVGLGVDYVRTLPPK
ncbi:TfoX/Sxy family protein [Nakamurella multipartita]|jgi:hypothetical protein|uniref:TfoX N-terminal domain-containing protein n=1 Tax=Nakamurella multipartita (strain ATCC 700099 / DSM 44233 / CIP 104796 / JCM 9543 / NBRC 105858 / Y-104) TaxID=479431 RepID=C8XKI8_NAKMY|nr:TfoX/Sxy family protein [Nakamurella multipartita]ACV78750.1 hypothetical protein Namu_2375 [Nakamurella multipartita DSM 44233]HOZ58839.1 TfoX/Sxy family protein [Nakamurella multipartita]